MKPLYIYYGILCIVMTSCHAIEPIAGLNAIFGTAIATFDAIFTITCQFKECCTKEWIDLNIAGISLHIYIVF
jgi:hypothetical protein